MADDDIERLLREVEASTSGTPAPGAQVARRSQDAVAHRAGQAEGGRLARAVRAGLVGGAVTGVIVFVIFMLTPFVSAWGPGVGAFVGGFLNGFYFTYRGR